MNTAAAPAARRVPFAPLLRAGRILWRILPWIGSATVLPVAALALGASAALLRQALVVGGSLAAYAVLVALVAEVLSPNRAALRMPRLTDRRAQRVSFGCRVLLFFLLVTELGAWLVHENHWRPSAAALLGVLRNVVLVLVAAGVLAGSGALRWLRSGGAHTFLGALGRALARWVVPLAVATALFVVIARGLGYLPLAGYVMSAATETAVKVVLAAMVFRYVSRGIQRAMRFVRQEEGDEAQGQPRAPAAEHPGTIGIQIIATGLFRLALVLATLLWILASWGASPAELLVALARPIFGDHGLTWGKLVGGFVDVAVVLLLGWLLKNVLVFFVFPRSTVDLGARYAILAMLRYTLVALALLFGLAALGVETGSLGWFFGAAGIGLGLGLQDIIGNFFGGLIMLLQRPIRVGDMVSVGDASGTVEDIRMRGTTIRTFDNTTILIPNREMLASRIQNLTYSMGHTRLRLDIGVSYEADPEQVDRILVDTARSHPHVLSEPPPTSVFQGYGPSSLDFSLFCYTGELRRRVAIASELRHVLFRRIRQAGIEIPFPQQVVHLKGGGAPSDDPRAGGA